MLNTVNTSKLISPEDFEHLNVLGNNVYELTGKGGRMLIEVIKTDLENKCMTIRHRHNTYDIVFKDDLDRVLDKMGIKRTSETLSRDVKAPMPGKVIEVIAKEGDQLAKGDGILILEAMKMENVIKAEAPCTIKKILISKLENVEKNQVLIELEGLN
jgi:biotin carboxyl carrier protein